MRNGSCGSETTGIEGRYPAVSIQSEPSLGVQVYEESRAFVAETNLYLPKVTGGYEKVMSFHRYFFKLRDCQRYLIRQIGNADQTPMYFNFVSNSTIQSRGAREVKVLSTGYEKLRFTVMLSCLADGTKLRPYIAFKQKTIPKNENLPKEVIVRSNTKGCTTDDMVVEWFRLEWCLQPAPLLRPNSVLVLDSFRGHLTSKVKDELRRTGTDMLVIPGGLTSQLQILDVGVNKPFMDNVQHLYEWLAQDDREITPSGLVKRALLAEACRWGASAYGISLDDDVLYDRKSDEVSSSAEDSSSEDE